MLSSIGCVTGTKSLSSIKAELQARSLYRILTTASVTHFVTATYFSGLIMITLLMRLEHINEQALPKSKTDIAARAKVAGDPGLSSIGFLPHS